MIERMGWLEFILIPLRTLVFVLVAGALACVLLFMPSCNNNDEFTFPVEAGGDYKLETHNGDLDVLDSWRLTDIVGGTVLTNDEFFGFYFPDGVPIEEHKVGKGLLFMYRKADERLFVGDVFLKEGNPQRIVGAFLEADLIETEEGQQLSEVRWAGAEYCLKGESR